ncbi:MAG: hypothetical protein KatS3mg010_0457 [Acidimicrobiia bacterium]|nr:MAG: hypothetical protein KatS3mg010_0457 [Acidimicrobiia bacterium]
MTGEPEDVPPLAALSMPDVDQGGYRAYPMVDHIADKIAATFQRYGSSDVAIDALQGPRRSRRRRQSCACRGPARNSRLWHPRLSAAASRCRGASTCQIAGSGRRATPPRRGALLSSTPGRLSTTLSRSSRPFANPLLDGTARGVMGSRRTRLATVNVRTRAPRSGVSSGWLRAARPPLRHGACGRQRPRRPRPDATGSWCPGTDLLADQLRSVALPTSEQSHEAADILDALPRIGRRGEPAAPGDAAAEPGRHLVELRSGLRADLHVIGRPTPTRPRGAPEMCGLAALVKDHVARRRNRARLQYEAIPDRPRATAGSPASSSRNRSTNRDPPPPRRVLPSGNARVPQGRAAIRRCAGGILRRDDPPAAGRLSVTKVASPRPDPPTRLGIDRTRGSRRCGRRSAHDRPRSTAARAQAVISGDSVRQGVTTTHLLLRARRRPRRDGARRGLCRPSGCASTPSMIPPSPEAVNTRSGRAARTATSG